MFVLRFKKNYCYIYRCLFYLLKGKIGVINDIDDYNIGKRLSSTVESGLLTTIWSIFAWSLFLFISLIIFMLFLSYHYLSITLSTKILNLIFFSNNYLHQSGHFFFFSKNQIKKFNNNYHNFPYFFQNFQKILPNVSIRKVSEYEF